MSTRGAIGFRLNGQDKLMYNHDSSYPSWLGKQTLTFLREADIDKMKAAAEEIKLVDEDKKPTAKQIKDLQEYGRTNSSEGVTIASGDLRDWYNLLREAQGNLSAYVNDGLRYMIDYGSFMYDSLSCEHAYIVNLDAGVLEYYRGCNKDENKPGRYTKVPKKYRYPEDNDLGYVGCYLAATVALAEIKQMSAVQIKELMANWESM